MTFPRCQICGAELRQGFQIRPCGDYIYLFCRTHREYELDLWEAETIECDRERYRALRRLYGAEA